MLGINAAFEKKSSQEWPSSSAPGQEYKSRRRGSLISAYFYNLLCDIIDLVPIFVVKVKANKVILG